jgi:hypothetical protein
MIPNPKCSSVRILLEIKELITLWNITFSNILVNNVRNETGL